MTEQELNAADVGALFQQVSRKGVTKRMRRDRFRDFANTVGLLALILNRVSGDVAAWQVAWKEPVLGPLHLPPVTQDL